MDELLSKYRTLLTFAEESGDIDRIRLLCKALLGYFKATTVPANPHEPVAYRAIVLNTQGGEELATGCLQYCIGYSEGYDCNPRSYGVKAVVCGQMVVWPEDRWGDILGG